MIISKFFLIYTCIVFFFNCQNLNNTYQESKNRTEIIQNTNIISNKTKGKDYQNFTDNIGKNQTDQIIHQKNSNQIEKSKFEEKQQKILKLKK